MSLRSGSVQLALCAMLVGTAPAWALAPHDRAAGVHAAEYKAGPTDQDRSAQIPKAAPNQNRATESEADEGRAARERQEDRLDKLRSDLIVGLIGALTLSVLLFQTRVFSRQAQSLRDTIVAMQDIGTKQSEDMQSSISAAQAAAEAGDRSADLARLALEAAETPFLVPIVTKFVPGDDADPPSASVIPVGSYCFENCGRSPAIILEERVEKYATSSNPSPVHWPFLNTNLYKTSILPQGRQTEKVYLTQGMFGDWTPADQTRAAMIVGAVRYADVFGNQFITGFSFYRNSRYGHWVGSGSTAHNFRRKLEGDDLRRARQRDSLSGPGAGHGFGDIELPDESQTQE